LSVSADARLEAGTVPVCACDDDPPTERCERTATRGSLRRYSRWPACLYAVTTWGSGSDQCRERGSATRFSSIFSTNGPRSFSYCRCVFAMLPARFCGGRVAFSSSQHRGLIPPVTLPQILYDITCCRSSGPWDPCESERTTEEFDHRGSCSLHQRCLTGHR